MGDDDTRDIAIRTETRLNAIERTVDDISRKLDTQSALLAKVISESEKKDADMKGRMSVIAIIASVFGSLFGLLAPWLGGIVKAFIATMH